MWAGSGLTLAKDNPSKVGDALTWTTELLSVVLKTTGLGEDMTVIEVKKILENKKGITSTDCLELCFLDTPSGISLSRAMSFRSWVCRKKLSASPSLSYTLNTSVPSPEVKSQPEAA